MLFRKLGKVVLGKATPFHIVVACFVGGLFAFSGAIGRAPGLWVLLFSVALILPVNLALVALTGFLLKLPALALTPASFLVGRVLLDGPTRPVFEGLINAPFFALCGFQYYVVSGGLLLGGLLGIGIGWLLAKNVRRLRRRLVSLDENSPRYQEYASKGWVKVASWLLLGGSPKRAKLEKGLGKRVGAPVRWTGVVAAVVVVALFWFVARQFSGPVLTGRLQAGLQRANGATVDLGWAELDLASANFEVRDLAAAVPERLDYDIFRGLQLQGDFAVSDLLRRRVHLQSLVVRQAVSGAKRETRGERLGGGAPGGEAPPAKEDEKSLEDYLADVEKWRGRLEQAQRWMETLSGAPDPEKAGKEGIEEDLRRWIEAKGYARVAADHLVKGAPTFLLGELRIEGLEALQLGGRKLDVTARNLSTHPHLHGAPPELSVRARDGSLSFSCKLGRAARGGGAAKNELAFAYKGLPGDWIASQLRFRGDAPLSGGTVDFAAQGSWNAEGREWVDLDCDVVLHDTTLALKGFRKPERIERLELPLALRGPLHRPRILFREQALVDALVAAGRNELAGRLKGALGERLEKELGDKIGKDAKKAVEDTAGGLFDRLRGKDKTKDDEKKDG